MEKLERKANVEVQDSQNGFSTYGFLPLSLRYLAFITFTHTSVHISQATNGIVPRRTFFPA